MSSEAVFRNSQSTDGRRLAWQRCAPSPLRGASGLLALTGRVPWLILIPCVMIPLFGLAGILRADELYGQTQHFERQVVWMIVSWSAMLLMTTFSYRRLKVLAPVIYLLSLVLLTAVLLMPAVNGSRRWIPLGLLDFQPSEPARLAFILALAAYLMHRRSHRAVAGLVPPFVMTVVPLLLILREPDLGTAMLFLPMLYAMLFAAGARPVHLLTAALIGFCLLPVLWTQMTAEQKSRVVMVFNQKDGGAAPSGDGFHLHQSKQVLALGGLEGSFRHQTPVTDDTAAWLLPASRTDFIMCLVGERYGIAGIGLLMAMYLSIVLTGLRIAWRTREPFGRLVAVGIVTMVGTQALINMAMTVGLMPITGITLPMCSYGGSSLLANCLAMGLLINIALRPGYEVAPGDALSTSQPR